MRVADLDNWTGFMSATSASTKAISINRPVSQLLPFNEHRFDLVMAHLARKHSRSLSQYDMMKLHVMADIYHVLETARPIIGGSLQPWTHGPVVHEAYNRVARWWHHYDRTGAQPAVLHLVEQDGNARRFEGAIDIDVDEFSEAEHRAMDRAWEDVSPLLDHWARSADFFHNPQSSFIGRAWHSARAQARAMDWNEIVDAYDDLHHTDHADIKTLMVI